MQPVWPDVVRLGVWLATQRKGPSCTTDGLTDYLAGWLAGWLTERQLKCSQDRQVEVVMVTVTGGVGAELLFSPLSALTTHRVHRPPHPQTQPHRGRPNPGEQMGGGSFVSMESLKCAEHAIIY